MKKKILIYLICITSILSLTGCGSKAAYMSPEAPMAMAKAEETYYDNKFGYDTMDYVDSENESGMMLKEDTSYTEEIETPKQNIELSTTNRKLIKTVNLDMQTKEFDSFTDALNKLVNKFNGYIENSDISGRDYDYYYSNRAYDMRCANYTIRIPKQSLDEFLNSINGYGITTNKSENVRDVTLSYVDTESKKEALKVEQDRLLEILASAENMDQIIMLEQRLSEIRYEVQSAESQLRTFDNQVDYSTVYIFVEEVEVEKAVPASDDTIFDKIRNNWESNIIDISYFFEELIVAMVSNLFVIFLEIAIIIGIIIVIIKIKKKKVNKKENKNKVENKETQENKKQE